jgi:methyl-accepting chemotaxis protein
MDANTIAHVRTSWKNVEAIAPTAAALFYENLFAAQPELRALFKADLTLQGHRLTQMIGAAVAGLDNLNALVPVLQQLAVRHVGYGVRDEHYDVVGAALIETLAQGLGEGFTPAVREAWTSTYALMATTMRAAARKAAVKAPPSLRSTGSAAERSSARA